AIAQRPPRGAGPQYRPLQLDASEVAGDMAVADGDGRGAREMRAGVQSPLDPHMINGKDQRGEHVDADARTVVNDRVVDERVAVGGVQRYPAPHAAVQTAL